MKVAVVVVLLLVAGQLPKNEAAFLSSLGDFFSSALESFSNTALQALANVGERLLRNVTATTTGLLSETGQSVSTYILYTLLIYATYTDVFTMPLSNTSVFSFAVTFLCSQSIDMFLLAISNT